MPGGRLDVKPNRSLFTYALLETSSHQPPCLVRPTLLVHAAGTREYEYMGRLVEPLRHPLQIRIGTHQRHPPPSAPIT